MTGPWWRSALGYEVYLRSFDGGTLDGVRRRLGHLERLGVEVVWITPFYPSPMHDGGYDVADYTGVDPRFGTLDDLEELVDDLHGWGMRLVIDVVPNHTSSSHPWFVEARSSRGSPKRDWYIWRDPGPDGGPPNNWVSHFGGSAWTLDEATGQYWLHLFLPEQPDLDWANPEVAAAFDDILRFWCERGVDGFRIDVAHGLHKHPDLPDLPAAESAATEGLELGSAGTDWNRFEHIHDMHQPSVLDVYRRWREVVEPYGALLLGEAYVLEAERLAPYVAAQDGLHASFWFRPLHLPWKPAALRDALVDAASNLGEHVAWVQSSHDRSRAVSRYGGGAIGRRRALALATLLAGLPGMLFLYQGEELGLDDGIVDDESDPIGRDACRTPIPWELAATQEGDPASSLELHRRLLAVRRSLPDEPVAWEAAGAVVAYRRGQVLVAANLGDQPAPCPGSGDLLFATDPAWRTAPHSLDPADAVILQLSG